MHIKLLLLLALVGCLPSTETSSGETAEAPISVPLAAALPASATIALDANGTVAGDNESLVAAGTTGRVASVHAERGQSVSKGDLLLKVDDRLLSASVDEARAALALAQANHGVAKDECERAQTLFDKGLSNQAALEKSKASCVTSEANEDAARARLRSVEVRLGDTGLRAPFDGVIAERRVSPGEYVRDDTPAFRLVGMDALRLELSVGEKEAARIQGGEKVEFEVPGETVVRTATVDRVAPSLNEKGRSLMFEAVVNDADGLKPGSFVRARVITGVQEAVSVPTNALRSDGGVHRLFVANGGQLEERLVVIGESNAETTIVLEGLKAGEKVASPLTAAVRDGARVQE